MAAIRRKKRKPEVKTIDKLVLINRLEALDRFEDALAILKADDLLYEKWSAAAVIQQTDKNARNLLETLGLDPDLLLGE